MPRLNTLLLRAAVVIAVAVVLVIGGFALARAVGANKVLADASVGPVHIQGLDREAALQRIHLYQDELEGKPAHFTVAGKDVTLDPAQVGFALDGGSSVDQALRMGREGSISQQFRWWIGHFFTSEELPLPSHLDQQALLTLLTSWDHREVADPPYEGAVVMQGTTPVAQYPKPGTQIDRSQAPGLVLDQLSREDRTTVELPLASSTPTLTKQQVDDAVAKAKLLLSAPVTLTSPNPGIPVTFTPAEMAKALTSAVVTDGSPHIQLSFDPAVVATRLTEIQNEVEQPPVDAKFEVDGNDVKVIPGKNGTLIDPAQTAQALMAAAGTASRAGVLPLKDGAPPEVTTADLESLGITQLVSRFTTYHSCCQPRVHNIHLFADIIDGAIVKPGDTFGLNEFMGERTSARGFLPAPTIIGGELVDTVGGGVSQFATTFYNAVFWGGYEDITHKPHSYYFTRYPEGIEGTISWPLPELKFRNDTSSAILIKTSYTGTSLTISFYGNNDGREVEGQQRSGRTSVTVLQEGGFNARKVSATVSSRYNVTTPGDPEYRPDPSLGVDQQRIIEHSSKGWTVDVTRTIEQAGATATQHWRVVYRAAREVLAVNPCKVPDSGIECPTTTTSAPSTTSSTSTSGSTSTTG